MTILIDLDNTISNLSHVLLRKLNTLNGTSHKYEEITSYDWFDKTFDCPWRITGENGFWDKVEISKDAVDTIEWMVERKNQVYIVTSSMISKNIYDKIRATLSHFNKNLINENNIIITKNKFLVRGDCLIDDCMDNFYCPYRQFDNAGVYYPNDSMYRDLEICFAQPWNKKFDYYKKHQMKSGNISTGYFEGVRVESWKEIRRIFDVT